MYATLLLSVKKVMLPAGQGVGVLSGAADDEDDAELDVLEVATPDVLPVFDALADEDELVVTAGATTRFAAICELSLPTKALTAPFLRKHVPDPAPFGAPK